MNSPFSKKRLYKSVSSIIALFAILFLIFRAYQGIRELSSSGLQISVEIVGVSIIFQIVGVSLAAAVWSDILTRMGVVSTYLFDLQVFGVSALGRKIPGVIWFVLSRVFMYEREGIEKSTIVLASIVELIANSIAGLIAVIFAVTMTDFRSPMATVLDRSQIISFLILGIFLLLSPILFRRVLAVISSRIKSIPTGTLTRWGNGDIFRWVAIDVIVTVLGAGVLYSVGRIVLVSTNLSFFFVLGAWGLLVAFGTIAVWIPGELGLKDGLMYLLISPFIGGPSAALLILAWRVWVSIMEIVFGIACGLNLGVFRLRSPGTSIND
jgi:hypothetical protein